MVIHGVKIIKVQFMLIPLTMIDVITKDKDPHIFYRIILSFPLAGSFEFFMGQKQQQHSKLHYPIREEKHFELFPLR